MIPLGGLAALIAVVVGGALISWLTERLVGRRIEVLHRTPNQRLVVATLTWLLVLTPAVGVGIWRLLVWIAEVHAASSEKVDVALLPGAIELGFPAAFLAMVVTAIPLSLWAERSEWRGISTWLVFFVLLAIPLALAAAMVDWYVVVTPDRFRYNPFFSVAERSFRYDQVRAIQRAPRTDSEGNTLPGHEYSICFVDGGAWRTTWHSGAAREMGRRIAHLVAERSEIEITDVKALPREEQPCPPGRKEQQRLARLHNGYHGFRLAVGALSGFDTIYAGKWESVGSSRFTLKRPVGNRCSVVGYLEALFRRSTSANGASISLSASSSGDFAL
jgi:hypothetical protein